MLVLFGCLSFLVNILFLTLISLWISVVIQGLLLSLISLGKSFLIGACMYVCKFIDFDNDN